MVFLTPKLQHRFKIPTELQRCMEDQLIQSQALSPAALLENIMGTRKTLPPPKLAALSLLTPLVIS